MKSKKISATIWGFKPLKIDVEFNKLVVLGQKSKFKKNLLKQIIKKAHNRGYSVHIFSESGILSNLEMRVDSVNDFSGDFENEKYIGSVVLYDGSIRNNKLAHLKNISRQNNTYVVYVGNSLEIDKPKDKFMVEAKVINYLANTKTRMTLENNGEIKEIRTLNFDKFSLKKFSFAIVVLGIGFGLGGMYNLRNVSLIGSGDYSLTAQETMSSGVLYSTPDGVGIGIMNSVKSEVSEKEITKAIDGISNNPNVGVLTLQANYYKTNQGLRAIVDFGLSAKVDVDKAIKSEKIKASAWKGYSNRNVSYVVVNTKAYDSDDKEKKEEETAKKALESGDLTTLSSDENISAVSNVSTMSAQVTQLPLFTDVDSMSKIKTAKTGSIVEIEAGNFKVLFKMESDEKSKKADKEYKSYLKLLASVQVGNELASKVNDNKKIDSASKIAIENDIKTALNQYGVKG